VERLEGQQGRRGDFPRQRARRRWKNRGGTLGMRRGELAWASRREEGGPETATGDGWPARAARGNRRAGHTAAAMACPDFPAGGRLKKAGWTRL